MASKESSSTGRKTGAVGVVEEKGKLEPAFLEEDDEFEEFPAEEWEVGKGDEDEEEEEEETNVWEDNWDDEIETDDFAKQLKEELMKTGDDRTAEDEEMKQ